MEHELYLVNEKIDGMELLSRFILGCRTKVIDSESESPLLGFADIVTAVYYYRVYPDVNVFIEKYLKGCADYFLIQWVRSTWESLDHMSKEEISDLVINQITLVANSAEEQ